MFVPARKSARVRWLLSSSYPAFRPVAAALRAVWRTLYAAGMWPRTVKTSGPCLLDDFLRGLDLDLKFVTALTSVNPSRVVLQLRDRTGTVIAYLKHATAAEDGRKLQNEYQVASALPQGLGPSILRTGEFRSGFAVLFSPIVGAPIRPTLPPSEPVIEYVGKLARPRREINVAQRWFDLPTQKLKDSAAVLSRRCWTEVIEHGDFAPWNIIDVGSGRVVAVDWEYGKLCGFPGIDLAHYILQTKALVKRSTPSAALQMTCRTLVSLGEPRITSEEAAAIGRLAAFDSYRRESASANGNRALQNWLMELWSGT